MTLFLISTAWMAGLALNNHMPFESHHWLILAGLSLFALLLTRENQFSKYLFGLLLVLCLASARGFYFHQKHLPTQITKFNDLPRPVQITGVISGYPEHREAHTTFVFRTESIQVGSGPASIIDGLVLARADRLTEWRYGDRLILFGRLETPPEFEDFSYRAYLARQDVFSILAVERAEIIEKNAANPLLLGIYAVRSQAHNIVGKIFPEPEASLLSGILLGLEAGISQDIRGAFDRTGTTHIIAISGFNITIIAGLFIGVGKRWLGAVRGTVIAALAIMAYTILVGADAAVVRATVMAFMALIAHRIGRRTDGLAALGGAAIIMSGLKPTILADVGFQLSLAATLGLVMYSKPLTDFTLSHLNRFPGTNAESLVKWTDLVSEYFTATLAAQITTLPLILFHFQRLSLIAPLANLLILPAQPAVMILSGVATLAGFVWLPIGQALAWLAWPFAKFTIGIVTWIAQTPLASLPTPPITITVVVAIYAGLTAVTLREKFGSRFQTSSPSRQLPWPAFILALIVANILVWRMLFSLPDGRLHLTLLETGNQPSILLETPQGRRLLINGGVSSVQLGAQLDTRINPFERQIDWIILSETTEEAAAGVAGLIERYSVGGALVVSPSSSQAYRTIADNLTQIGRPVGPILDGQVMNLGSGAWLKLRQVEEGSIFILEYGDTRYLLVIGQPQGWLDLLNPADSSNVSSLLLPGSGDASLSPVDQTLALQPQIIMLAIDPGDARGLPARSLRESTRDRTLLRTDQHGWITISSDGSRLWVRTKRLPGRRMARWQWPLESPPAFTTLLRLD